MPPDWRRCRFSAALARLALSMSRLAMWTLDMRTPLGTARTAAPPGLASGVGAGTVTLRPLSFGFGDEGDVPRRSQRQQRLSNPAVCIVVGILAARAGSRGTAPDWTRPSRIPGTGPSTESRRRAPRSAGRRRGRPGRSARPPTMGRRQPGPSPGRSGESPMPQTVRFWVDPICPWCWVTARWAMTIAPERDLHLQWEPISLFFKNDPGPRQPGLRAVAVDARACCG